MPSQRAGVPTVQYCNQQHHISKSADFFGWFGKIFQNYGRGMRMTFDQKFGWVPCDPTNNSSKIKGAISVFNRAVMSDTDRLSCTSTMKWIRNTHDAPTSRFQKVGSSTKESCTLPLQELGFEKYISVEAIDAC